MPAPKTINAIYEDYLGRREGLLQALTEDVSEFFEQCDPGKANLCLYGHPDQTWTVGMPAEEVPPELPEPVLGINFARDGMERKDWLALCAVHSDAWLFGVLFFYAARFDDAGRAELFSLVNQHPTVYEVVTGRVSRSKVYKRKQAVYEGRAADAEPADQPLPSGRPLTFGDLSPALRGRNAELFWPDDGKWYLVQIYSFNMTTREAQVQYATGEFEALNLDEVARDGHMSLLPSL